MRTSDALLYAAGNWIGTHQFLAILACVLIGCAIPGAMP